MIARIAFVALILAYAIIIVPFASYMKERPIALKLGYVPEAEIVKITCADYQNVLAQGMVVKVLFYFGTLVEKFEHKVKLQPEYFNMFKTLQTSVKLDPYNMDAYYFTQAVFTWELHRIEEVNDMLDYGMKYRTWDDQLPFFAGFNAAYFQKDYGAAARYMKKAAEISKNPLYTTLAARYFYEAGQNSLGLIFIDSMQAGAKDKKVQKLYLLRRQALIGVNIIQDALKKYHQVFHKMPSNISDLVSGGYLSKIPVDPYGGQFYLTSDGKVKTTSNFAFVASPK